MAGSKGVSGIKQLMTTGKLGAISVLQAIARDGFQVKDFAAPLKSPLFLQAVEESGRVFVQAIQESGELDLADKWAIGIHAYDCWKDLATEGKLAIKAIKNQTKKVA